MGVRALPALYGSYAHGVYLNKLPVLLTKLGIVMPVHQLEVYHTVSTHQHWTNWILWHVCH